VSCVLIDTQKSISELPFLPFTIAQEPRKAVSGHAWSRSYGFPLAIYATRSADEKKKTKKQAPFVWVNLHILSI
jgi:hypothetical protein